MILGDGVKWAGVWGDFTACAVFAMFQFYIILYLFWIKRKIKKKGGKKERRTERKAVFERFSVRGPGS